MNPITDAKRSTITFNFDDLSKTLARMRDESIRYVKDPYSSHDGRVAWFYCQLGAYDLAHDMGWITDAELRAFYDEMFTLAPVEHDHDLGPAVEEPEPEPDDPLADLMRDRANELGVIVR